MKRERLRHDHLRTIKGNMLHTTNLTAISSGETTARPTHTNTQREAFHNSHMTLKIINTEEKRVTNLGFAEGRDWNQTGQQRGWRWLRNALIKLEYVVDSITTTTTHERCELLQHTFLQRHTCSRSFILRIFLSRPIFVQFSLYLFTSCRIGHFCLKKNK